MGWTFSEYEPLLDCFVLVLVKLCKKGIFHLCKNSPMNNIEYVATMVVGGGKVTINCNVMPGCV